MNVNTLLIILIIFFLLIFVGVFAYLMLTRKKENNLENLIKVTRPNLSSANKNSVREKMAEANEDIREITETQRRNYSKKKIKVTEEERYYHAGLLSNQQRDNFKKFRLYVPFVAGFVMAVITYFMLGKGLVLFGLVIGILAGLTLPGFYLDRLIKNRYEEIMYYLPLVIEQIAIGVSSSLDIGPCLQRVIQMADERDSHNVVTELIFHAERYIRTGVSLEEAMNEIGTKSGHPELKHAFMALAQVSKHGGEISHQLQELANAVSSQRETQIDSKIKRLELQATGPVALVFVAFMGTLMIGIMIKIKKNL